MCVGVGVCMCGCGVWFACACVYMCVYMCECLCGCGRIFTVNVPCKLCIQILPIIMCAVLLMKAQYSWCEQSYQLLHIVGV